MSLLAQLNSTLSVALENIAKADDNAELELAIKKAKPLCEIASRINEPHRIVLDANKIAIENGCINQIDNSLLSIGHNGIKDVEHDKAS